MVERARDQSPYVWGGGPLVSRARPGKSRFKATSSDAMAIGVSSSYMMGLAASLSLA